VQKKVKHMMQKIFPNNANEAEETSVQSNDRNKYFLVLDYPMSQ